ncbi:hypothetical protein FNJ62_04255 [Streptomyces benahoarensis]|nr:hypothetical protein [Streptomyces benahoarensis]TSB31881.1 hypothetical protein FNJ62_04255 [Streptomyces benahoarensis]
MIEHTTHDDGRVRILVRNEAGGHDIALAPGTEPVWRKRRPHEPASGPKPRPYRWAPCDDCITPHTCEELQDLDRCP